MRHSDSTEDLILPIYTTAEERFWLFQASCKPSRVAKCVYSTKVKGNWSNLQGDGNYNIIHSDNIIGKNRIRSAHGPLYFSYKPGATRVTLFCPISLVYHKEGSKRVRYNKQTIMIR